MTRTTPTPFDRHAIVRFTIAAFAAILVSRALPMLDHPLLGVASAAAELACDTDGDGSCDASDPCPDDGRDDADGDGVCVGSRFNAPMIGGGDNCPSIANADQANADGDDRGDACDMCPNRSGTDEDACLGTGSWSSLAPSNTPRSESGFVAAGDKLYVIGGEQTAASRSVEIYDPATDTWSNGPMLPSSRHHIAPVVIGSKIYLPGGLVAFPGPSLDENLVLDTNDLAAGWQSLAPLPTSRGALGCTASGVRIYCAGGLSSTAANMAIDVFEMYNTIDDAWTTLPSMPRPRDHFEPQIVDGKFYAIGGRDTSIAATYSFNDIYDIAAGTWSLGAPIPTPRGGHATEIFEGRILVIGGEGNGPSAGTFPNVEEYDPVRDLWRTLADIPTPRHGFGAALSRAADGVTPVLYAATGSPKQGFGFTTVTDKFEFNTCNGAAECDDGNPCTIDTCNAAGSCENTAVANGGICDDGLACTSNDVCTAGVCAGTINCAAASICNVDTGNCELPALICIDAGSDPTAAFNGAMTKGPAYTGGADDDPARNSLTSQMLYPNSTSNAPTGGSGDRVVYTFNLPFRGDWAMWGRFYYPNEPGSNQANSFLVGIDFGLLKKFGNNRDYFRQFHYDGDGSKESGPLLPILLPDLAKGSHKLTIEKREVQPIPPRLDVVCFSQDLVDPPTDARVRTALAGTGTTTTLPVVTTTLPVATTTLPAVTTTVLSPTTTLPVSGDLSCWPAASGRSPAFSGAMTTGTDFTGGADADGAADNLTAPLVFADSTTNANNGGSGDQVSYDVVLPTAGTWYVWGRFYYPGAPGSNDANSFLIRADAGAPKKLGNNKGFYQRWHYDGDGAVESGPGVPLSLGNLSAGPHTITVEKREVAPGAPPRIDVLCMTQDSAMTPDDTIVCDAIGGCGAAPTTTLPAPTTTLPTPTTTLPAPTTTLPTPTTTLPAPTTTLPTPTTTLPTTSTTLPVPDDVFCLAAGTDPTASFSGNMTVGSAYTNGFDSDPGADNLTAPLVFADSAANAANGGSGDQVTYVVDLPTGGNWYLWGRFYYPGDPNSNQANSFLASVDGGLLSKFGNNRDYFQTWHFDGDGAIESGPTAPLFLGNLGAGAHVLKIEKREVTPIAPRLDVLCLSKDPFTQFTDEMACAELGGCGAAPTTTLPVGATTTTTLGGGALPTTTTLPPIEASLVCVAAGSDPSAVFAGSMTADTTFTAGADFDAAADSLTSSLAYAASAVNSFSGASGDQVTYTIALPSSGRWYLWARMYYPGTPGSNDANSFFASLDGGSPRTIGNKSAFFQTWHFDGDGSTSNGPAVPLDLGVLPAGAHQITVAKREVVPIAPRLDVLCLSKDPFAPSDAEACTALGGCD